MALFHCLTCLHLPSKSRQDISISFIFLKFSHQVSIKTIVKEVFSIPQHHKPTMIRDGFVCFEAQISVGKPTGNVEALTDRIFQLESDVYKLKETCKGTIHMLRKHLEGRGAGAENANFCLFSALKTSLCRG